MDDKNRLLFELFLQSAKILINVTVVLYQFERTN